MHIDLTNNEPVIDYRQAPRQLIIRVGHTLDIDGFVAESAAPCAFPVDCENRDHEAARAYWVRDFIIRPGLFKQRDWPSLDEPWLFMIAYSADRDLRGARLTISLALRPKNLIWYLGIDIENIGGQENEHTYVWVPMPDYDPYCTELPGAGPLPEECPSVWERVRKD